MGFVTTLFFIFIQKGCLYTFSEMGSAISAVGKKHSYEKGTGSNQSCDATWGGSGIVRDDQSGQDGEKTVAYRGYKCGFKSFAKL